MTPVRRGILPLVVTVTLATVGCSADEPDDAALTTPTPRVIQGAAPGGDNELLTAMPDIPAPEATEADIEFVQMMLVHHAQALEMTALVPERTSREDVPLFAERVALSQADEIDQMNRWLEDREVDAGHEHHEMPGLLTEDQMEELEAAAGEDFDRLFLQFMHYHHDGALTMVQDLWDAGGGQELELSTLVNHIDSDQRIEMDRIEAMLADMGTTP